MSPFAALDDGFHHNRKIVRAGNEAAGIYARSLSYCADEGTNGYVPRAWALEIVAGRRGVLDKLTKASLWTPVKAGDEATATDRSGNEIAYNIDEPGFLISDFLAFNLSSVEVEHRREQRAKAGEKGARSRWGDGKRHGIRHSKRHDESHGGSDGNPDGKSLSGSHGKPMAQSPLPKPRPLTALESEVPVGSNVHSPKSGKPPDFTPPTLRTVDEVIA